MKPEMRDKILAYNLEKKADKEKADDLLILLGALPPGQVRQLLKDETCVAILKKYGVEGAQ